MRYDVDDQKGFRELVDDQRGLREQNRGATALGLNAKVANNSEVHAKGHVSATSNDRLPDVPHALHALVACTLVIAFFLCRCLIIRALFGSTRQEGDAEYSTTKKCKIVLERFSIGTERADILGEGGCATCRRGSRLRDGKQITIKVYKTRVARESKADAMCLERFHWQITVLQALHGIYRSAASNANDELSNKRSSDMFVLLFDFSRDAQGKPGVDVASGDAFVVLEFGEYTLANYLTTRVDFHNKLPAGVVQDTVKALVLIVAGLHAKGFVHLNLKPSSFMSFSGRLKLASTDNCVKAGSHVSIVDTSIHYSPAYCSPEWARFVLGEPDAKIVASPTCDVWSLGLTICEVATSETVMKQMYSKFLTRTQSDHDAGFAYMAWLSAMEKVPVSMEIKNLDGNLGDLLNEWMLVYDNAKRKDMIQCLSHRYCEGAQSERKFPMLKIQQEQDISTEYSHKGTLWELQAGADAADPNNWFQQDMWITPAGSLCFYSHKEKQRLVRFDCEKLIGAVVSTFIGGRKHAFQVQLRPDDDEAIGSACFASDSSENCEIWMTKLRSVTVPRRPTACLEGPVYQFGRTISLQIQNKREKVESAASSVAIRGQLWKVKGNGDRRKEEHWRQREMWIDSDGNLAYWSEKEQHELFHYTSGDLLHSTVTLIDDEDSFRPWAFQVQLPLAGEVAFHPGEFAAESDEARTRWLAALQKCGASVPFSFHFNVLPPTPGNG